VIAAAVMQPSPACADYSPHRAGSRASSGEEEFMYIGVGALILIIILLIIFVL
jgi:hypothetical protein